MHTLVVGVLTYQRPDRLRVTLSAILDQIRELNGAHRGITANVLVIDNDPAASARSAVAYLGADRVRYVHEPVPGISAGRNRALREAGNADLLAFIDDDEVPRAGWLSALIDTWLPTRPAAVMGRVFFNVPGGADPWVVAGGFFDRARRRTGTEMAVAAAGNLLLDLRQVRALDVRFDPRLGLSGGEDTLFSRLLVKRGGRILWCDESVADDFVPPERATRDWVLQRAWRVGNCTAIADQYLADTTAGLYMSRLRYATRGLLRIAGGSVRVAMARLTHNARHEARGMRTCRRGQGMLAGARGARFDEYARSAPREA